MHVHEVVATPEHGPGQSRAEVPVALAGVGGEAAHDVPVDTLALRQVPGAVGRQHLEIDPERAQAPGRSDQAG